MCGIAIKKTIKNRFGEFFETNFGGDGINLGYLCGLWSVLRCTGKRAAFRNVKMFDMIC